MRDRVISATEPDWSREAKSFWSWNPSRSLLASIRDHRLATLSDRADALFWRKVAVVRHRFWSLVTGADIPLGCRIGGGLLLPHPNGVVIHPGVRIGPNCVVFQQVTLGTRGPGAGVPVLGGRVDIGAGAKVLGAVRLGERCRIGSNAVVLHDVPPGTIAVGIPARVIDASLRAPELAEAGP